ncbi:serine/threonine-protein phosphatase [Streptomyces anulatus]|uniref:PP2C family protein-serine/threonine phosphatase n=1 Tax=Streptomyces anulatus TaxID=1892 RepID=UPI001C5D406C|nr:PP2C family protein-serine/threonine phosphatase [Streptomyces anulatus]QYA98333.1 serine/threonine-protein phosphatase [Streptomyces anulatus]
MSRIAGRRAAGTGRAVIPSSDLALLPFALIAVGVAFQLLTPAHLNGSPFFTAAPLVAAPFFGKWKTAAIGGAAVAVAAALQTAEWALWGRFDVRSMERQLSTVAFAAVLAVLLSIVVRRGREQLTSAREVAEAVQRAVLRSPAEYVGGLRVAARYEAAQRDALIGGDLYCARTTPHGVRLVMGDVRGKGMAAVETVAVVLGAFREASEHERTLAGLAQRLEEALARDLADREDADSAEAFVTCVLVEIPAGHWAVRVVNCGHPAPLLLDGHGGVTILTPSEYRLPLGMYGLAPAPYRPDTWEFPQGVTLLLYTDGLSEARDASGVFYDPATRLTGRPFPTPGRLLSMLADDVQHYSGGVASDDMALLAAQRPCSEPGAGDGRAWASPSQPDL